MTTVQCYRHDTLINETRHKVIHVCHTVLQRTSLYRFLYQTNVIIKQICFENVFVSHSLDHICYYTRCNMCLNSCKDVLNIGEGGRSRKAKKCD